MGTAAATVIDHAPEGSTLEIVAAVGYVKLCSICADEPATLAFMRKEVIPRLIHEAECRESHIATLNADQMKLAGWMIDRDAKHLRAAIANFHQRFPV